MTEQRISNRARLMAIPAIGAVAVGVAAFSRGGFAQDSTATPSASPSPSASPMATPAGESAEQASSGAASSAVTVAAGDLFFDPKELTIPAGTDAQVTFNNGGALAHDWALPDQNIGTDLQNPGGTQTITVNLPAGDYQYICTVPGHAEAGMVGTLHVV
jgi:nitrite reductase (NO-forming)